MSQPPHIIVAIGRHSTMKLPNQSYGGNGKIHYNIQDSDVGYYNKFIEKYPPINDDQNIDIYGFLPGGSQFINDTCLQKVTNFFQYHSEINILTFDLIYKNNLFKQVAYIQPNDPKNNAPFFVRSSLIDQIKFVDDKQVFRNVINTLRDKGYIIFHLAEPLISISQEVSE